LLSEKITMHKNTVTNNPFNIIVIVAALGYFVDIYDLILFGIVKDMSLKEIIWGITDPTFKLSHIQQNILINQGASLLGIQMMGMLIGGIIWGILGDKLGRLSTLFLTILLYSIATLVNGFVHDITQYSILRFIAGVGLAGELGVGITLVSEVMSKESRGWGTTMVSGVGIAGAVLGYLVSTNFGWRETYYVGGGLGFVLLILRISVYESGMFKTMKEKSVSRGNFLKLFTNGKRFKKYLFSIMIGIPVWYVIGILVIFSPQFAGKDIFNIQGTVTGGKAVMYHYIGASIGSFVTGMISQHLHSRKKAIYIALIALLIFIICYFSSFNASSTFFYIILFMLGVAQGYWAVFVTTASEQFGTNLRATVTTTVPNFVRGMTTPMTLALALGWVQVNQMWNFTVIVGIIVMSLALYALYKMDETYGKDLDYFEEI